MIRKFKYLTSIIISVFFVNHTVAQSANAHRREADKAYNNGNFYAAAALYNKAIALDNSLYLWYQSARALHQNRNYPAAENAYLQAFNLDSANTYPLLKFYIASVQKSQAKYESAIENYRYFIDKEPNKNSYYFQKSQHEIHSCQTAIELMQSDLKGQPLVTQLSSAVNSVWSEFAALELNDSTLLFTSLQPDLRDSDKFLTQIYKTVKINESWQKSELIEHSTLMSDSYISNFSFDSLDSILYFSAVPRETLTESAIFTCRYVNGKLLDAKRLPEIINFNGSYTTQPHIAYFDSVKVLFFVSNRNGGAGNLDIWYSNFDSNGQIAKPINAGSKINSPDDEITPFYSIQDSALFFSSAWHNSLGGFDVFKITGNPFSAWDTVQNLGAVINSSYDDMYFTINQSHTLAYLASNRRGSLSYQNETCCNDIYSIVLEQVTTPVDTFSNPTPELTETDLLIGSILQTDTITLYFHDSQPDSKSKNPTTDKNYQTLVNEYLIMRGLYKRKYSAGLNNAEKVRAENEIDSFFTNKISKNYNELFKLAKLLEKTLMHNIHVEMIVKGYASPLGSVEYNKNLSGRRISSVMNFFSTYENGLFQPYLTGGQQNLLTIRPTMFGESQSPHIVSDSAKEKRHSIYSPEAAAERRVQVIIVSARK